MGIEKKVLEKLYIDRGLVISEVASELNVSISTVNRAIKKYNLGSIRFWSEKDVEYLYNNFGGLSIATIAKVLNRTVKAVRYKAYKLGLNSFENSDLISAAELARALGVGKSLVYKWINKKGLKCKNIVLSRKKRFRMINIDEFWCWAYENQDLVNFSRFEEFVLGKEPSWAKVKRVHDVLNNSKTNKPFSKFENDYIRQYYKILDAKEIAKVLNRSVPSIHTKANRLGIVKLNKTDKKEHLKKKSRKKYTRYEDYYILSHYKYKTAEEIGIVLGRTQVSIHGRASRIRATKVFRKHLENQDNRNIKKVS